MTTPKKTTAAKAKPQAQTKADTSEQAKPETQDGQQQAPENQDGQQQAAPEHQATPEPQPAPEPQAQPDAGSGEKTTGKLAVLKVTARGDSFRRANLQFGSKPRQLIVDELSDAQLKAIRNEPRLVVVEDEIDVEIDA